MTLYQWAQAHNLMNKELWIIDSQSENLWDGRVLELWDVPVWDQYQFQCQRLWRVVEVWDDLLEEDKEHNIVMVSIRSLIEKNLQRLIEGKLVETNDVDQVVKDLHVYFSGHMSPIWVEAFVTALIVPDCTIEEELSEMPPKVLEYTRERKE